MFARDPRLAPLRESVGAKWARARASQSEASTREPRVSEGRDIVAVGLEGEPQAAVNLSRNERDGWSDASAALASPRTGGAIQCSV